MNDFDTQSQELAQNIPPEYKNAFDRLTAAGYKFMASEDSQQMIDDELDKDKKTPIGELIGKYVAGLIVMLVSQSRGAVPQEILIPSGVELVIQACKHIDKSRRDVSMEDMAIAMQTFIYSIMEAAGLQPDQFDEIINSLGGE